MRANEIVASSAGTSALVDALRSGTATEHALIEGTLKIMREDFTCDDYVRLLLGFLEFHKAFEPAVSAALQPQAAKLKLDQRRKVPRLMADLSACGYRNPMISHQSSSLSYRTTAEAIGALYVVEGSTLGGSVISRHLRSKFPELAGALCFFSSYGDETGKMWREFLGLAAEFVPQKSFGLAVQSAVDTFRIMREHLVRVQ